MKALEQLRADLLRLSSDPGQAVRAAADLPELVQSCGPGAVEMDARAEFVRSSDWSLHCLFQNVESTAETYGPRDVTTTQGRVWVRGLVGVVYPWFDARLSLGNAAAYAQPLGELFGEQYRGLVELNYSVDGMVGFVEDGQTEVFAEGRTLLGTSEFAVPLDWVLEQNRVIQVQVRSRVPQLGLEPDIPLLRYVAITFYGQRVE